MAHHGGIFVLWFRYLGTAHTSGCFRQSRSAKPGQSVKVCCARICSLLDTEGKSLARSSAMWAVKIAGEGAVLASPGMTARFLGFLRSSR